MQGGIGKDIASCEAPTPPNSMPGSFLLLPCTSPRAQARLPVFSESLGEEAALPAERVREGFLEEVSFE